MRRTIFAMMLFAVGGCGSEPVTTQTEATTPQSPSIKVAKSPNDTPTVVTTPQLQAIDEEVHRQQPAYHAAPDYVYAQARIGKLVTRNDFLEVYNRANRAAGRPDVDPQAMLAAQAAKAGAQ